MTRSHRALHRLLWPMLALAVGLGFVMALALRPAEEPPAATAAQEPRQ